jgi:prolyl-tRNA synthetase
MVRGDCDVNETKVKDFLRCDELTLASPDVIKALTGAEVGYAGPIGLPSEVAVVADNYTNNRINFECGANRTDYHNINVNFGRDLPLPTFGDFKEVKEGDLCPRCDGGKLKETNGIEVGRILKLGKGYSEKLNCTYLDKNGKPNPVFMGSYEVGVSRVAAALVEQNHDDSGIIWPVQVAPFHIHLIALNLENEDVKKQAEKLYRQLVGEKIDVIFDDRDLRAGEKFRDADLLGIPIRLTVSKRTFNEQKLEFKFRNKKESKLLTYEEVMKEIRDFDT